MAEGRLENMDPEQLRRLLEERTADLRRVKAEYDNYRKRVGRDRMAVREIAAANVLRSLLPVLDAVERTCAHEPLTAGLADIAGTLHTQTGALGLTAFGEEGDPFDPVRHEAVTHQVAPDSDGLICTKVLRYGYRLGDHLLRPAHVEVTGPPPADTGPPTAGTGRPAAETGPPTSHAEHARRTGGRAREVAVVESGRDGCRSLSVRSGYSEPPSSAR